VLSEETTPSPSQAAVAPDDVTELYVLLVVSLIVDSSRQGLLWPALISLMSGSSTSGSAKPIDAVPSGPDRMCSRFTRAIASRSCGFQNWLPNVGLRNTLRKAV
jgi:hypothetical protein